MSDTKKTLTTKQRVLILITLILVLTFIIILIVTSSKWLTGLSGVLAVLSTTLLKVAGARETIDKADQTNQSIKDEIQNSQSDIQSTKETLGTIQKEVVNKKQEVKDMTNDQLTNFHNTRSNTNGKN